MVALSRLLLPAVVVLVLAVPVRLHGKRRVRRVTLHLLVERYALERGEDH